MLRSLKRFGFDQDELTVVYKSYVRPVIEYDVVWHSVLTHKQAGDLERVQRRACRTILGRQFTTYTESIKQCNLDRLSERRVDHCLKFAKGLVDNPRTVICYHPPEFPPMAEIWEMPINSPNPRSRPTDSSRAPSLILFLCWTSNNSLPFPLFSWLSCPQGWMDRGGGGSV